MIQAKPLAEVTWEEVAYHVLSTTSRGRGQDKPTRGEREGRTNGGKLSP